MSLSESRNWADLPGEITHLISIKLPPDCIYLLTFCVVCKNWRTSAPLSDLRRQLPWLIEREEPYRNSILGPNLRFYSLAGGDTGTICIPEPYHGMLYYGPGHGYLLVSSLDDDLFLLNPLDVDGDGDVISLPKLNHGFRILASGCNGTDQMHNWHVFNTLRGSSIEGGGGAAIYRADRSGWHYILSCNTCCWDGKRFAFQSEHGMGLVNVVSEKMSFNGAATPEVPGLATYLVESCGDILRVTCNYGHIESAEFGIPQFDVYKLQFEERRLNKPCSWVKISDIGNHILFLDLVNGFSTRAPTGSQGNCIYFLSEDGDQPRRYDLGTRQVERLSCPFRNCTWFVPNLC